ncbi:MAG: response regulator, partial [Sphingomonadales bacterium]
LIEGMRDLISSSIGPTIELQLRSDPDLPQALADPGQLELAVLNLCVNARDAMPDGGKLAISTRLIEIVEGSGFELPAGDYIRLSVEDSGTGMDADTLARAVEPFFSTKEIGRGTGLGLSMVHGLIAQLGGVFMLDSTPGQGTRADLYLRVTGDRSEIERGVFRDTPLTATQTLSILLVDDEELVREGTAEMLRSLGHEVIEADGGEEALRKLKAVQHIQLIVTDYKMPRMDGAELARQVRFDRPGMPMLLISGYTGGSGPIADLPRLNKPFGLVELSEALRTVTGQFEPA